MRTSLASLLFFVSIATASSILGCSADSEPPPSPRISDAPQAYTQIIAPRFAAGDSQVTPAVIAGPSAYFVANDVTNGRELWRSDGTDAWTVLVRDFFPGPTGSDPEQLTELAGNLVVSLDAPRAGRQLWMTDGSPGGFVRLTPLSADGGAPVGYTELTRSGSRIFFIAEQAALEPRTIWSTDGTPVGTQKASTSGISLPRSLVAVDGGVVFVATSVAGTEQLNFWNGDPASAPLALVELAPGAKPRDFVSAGLHLYFSATTPGSGRELWRSDGTAQGTEQLTETGGGDAGDVGDLVVFGEHIAFSADDGATGREPWIFDGRDGGTRRLANIHADGSSAPSFLGDVGGFLYFAATSQSTGRELWKTDGTPSGTVPFVDASGAKSGSPQSAALLDGRLYFSVTEFALGTRLVSTDGTSSRLVALASTENLWGYERPALLGRQLIFPARSFLHGRELHGFNLDHSSDGGVVRRLRDIASAQEHALPRSLVVNGDHLYFSARHDGSPYFRLYRSAGDQTPVQELAHSGNEGGSVWGADRGVIFVGRSQVYGRELFAYGSVGESSLLLDLGAYDSTFDWGRSHNGLAIICGRRSSSDGGMLIASDGTPAGTTVLSTPSVDPAVDPVTFGSYLIFATLSGEIWRTTGINFATQRFTSLRGANAFFVAADRLYVRMQENGLERLFVVAPSATVSQLFVHANGGDLVAPNAFAELDGELMFIAGSGGERHAFRTDGTVSGTHPVAPVAMDGEYRSLGTVGGRYLYFDDRPFSSPVWSLAIDGGTEVLGDFMTPSEFIRIAPDAAFFAAATPEHGLELYLTDGTAAGTSLVTERISGVGSTNPEFLTVFRDHLYFSGDDGFGSEVLRLSIANLLHDPGGSPDAGVEVDAGRGYVGDADAGNADPLRSEDAGSDALPGNPPPAGSPGCGCNASQSGGAISQLFVFSVSLMVARRRSTKKRPR